jgi:hypothetical protein
MPIFKTTQTIFNSAWGEEFEDDQITSVPAHFLPTKEIWNLEREMTISDVKFWEQIYYKSGDIGVYAAWNPYGELYMIVHNLFINTTFGLETFYGEEAVNDVWKRAEELGVVLPGTEVNSTVI